MPFTSVPKLTIGVDQEVRSVQERIIYIVRLASRYTIEDDQVVYHISQLAI